jgi:hypothetical protein
MLDRRAFLSTSAAALAASAFATIPSSTASAAVGAPRRAAWRGLWWFYPSFLEHPEGPWGVCRDRSASPLGSWKDCLSWLADHGVDSAFIHFGPFGGSLSPQVADRVRTGWGFHYLLDFERFPEARTFDRATLQRNRELLNAICAHGKAVGCAVYTHHYNFSAPKPFVDAHRDELLRAPVGSKRETKTLYPGYCDHRQILHRNLCWNSPLYREFMIACWRETCRAIPDLAGILVTPGENARCPCVRCVGPTDDPDAPFATNAERLATLGDFVRTFAATLDAAGREPLVRAWAAGKSRAWIDVFPKGVTYFLKYSFFDVVDSPPDPAIAEWVAAGHRVVTTPEIQGGENGGPQLWRRAGYLPSVVSSSLAAGAAGVVACVNSEHGFLSTPHRIQHAPVALFAHAVASAGKVDDAGLAREFDRAIFGAAGEDIHAGLAECSEVMFLLPRIVFEPDEGYTWQFSYKFFSDEWPGRLGGMIDAEEWIARDLAPLSVLLEAASAHPYCEPFAAPQLAGKSDPVAALSLARDTAVAGERRILAASSAVPAAAAADYALVRASARLAVLLGDEWLAMLRARVLFEAALAPCNTERRAQLAADCIASFAAAIAAIDGTVETANGFEPGLVGDGLIQRVPRKRAERVAERDEAARRLGLDSAPAARPR